MGQDFRKRPIVVELALRGGRTFLRITDDGGPFALPAADLEDLWAETGRGLAMIARLGGQVAVHASGAGKTVIVELPVARTRRNAPHSPRAERRRRPKVRTRFWASLG